MDKIRKPKDFDQQAWDAMPHPQRIAEADRHRAVKAARRRYEQQQQRYQITFDRNLRRARQEMELAIERARAAYRAAEEEAFR